jgi:hypothetical protein
LTFLDVQFAVQARIREVKVLEVREQLKSGTWTWTWSKAVGGKAKEAKRG